MNSVWRILVGSFFVVAIGCQSVGKQTSPAAGGSKVVGAAAPAAIAVSQPAVEPMAIEQRIVTDDGTTVVKLENGLTVIVKAMHSSPVVCVKAYVRAGAMYEKEWLGCGLSHLVEHLVAEGAEQDKAAPASDQTKKEPSRVQEIGGQSNAFTSHDETCYFISATAGKTMACIDLVADWLARPNITSVDFEREHGVVQRELEMKDDDPDRMMWEAHVTAAFGTHPISLPVIGYRKPLANLTLDEVRTYHRRMYVPQNMVFCVVGNVNVEQVLARVQKDFAGFAAGRRPTLDLPAVQPIAGVVRTVLTHPQVKEVSEQISFQTIPLLHEDLYTLDVLSYVLSQGQSSRLVQNLVRQQKLVTAVDTSSWTPQWGKGVFEVSFRCEPAKADAAEKAILDELRAVMEKGVTDAELSRAKKQKIADFVYPQQSVDSVAGQLATDYLNTGDVAFSQNYTRKIQSVTAEGVQQAAKKYFNFEQMAVTRMVPPVLAAAQTTTSRPATEAPGPVTFTLANGLRVVLAPNSAVGLVAMTFVTRGGLLLENDKTNGLGTLMTALSTKGAGAHSAEEIARFFDAAGGKVGGMCGKNTFLWQATVLDDSFTKALPIFADVIVRPTYPEKELDILRPMLMAALYRMDQDRDSAAFKFFRQKFFTGSPYGLMEIGNAKVVQGATRDQIANWHKGLVLAGESVLAIYGKFDAQAARQEIEKLFGELPAGQNQLEIPPAREVARDGEVYTQDRPKESASTILIGLPGMRLSNLEDRYAMEVLATIVGGVPAGWLFDELRGKQLVYAVSGQNMPGLAPGAFIVHADCQPEKAPEVIELIRKNLGRATTYAYTQPEVDHAVNTILTAELLKKQQMSDLATDAALNTLYYGKDLRAELEARYRQVKPADVLRVAKKYLSGPVVLTVVGPQPELVKTK